MTLTKEQVDKARADLDDLRKAILNLERLVATIVNRQHDLENFLNEVRKQCI